METAAAIAKEIGIQEISVNYKFAEWLKWKFYPKGSPIQGLIINKSDAKEYSKKWLSGINVNHNTDYAQALDQRYPEIYEVAAERVQKFSDRLLKQHGKS